MSDGFELQRMVSQKVSRAFGLRHDEIPTFHDGWELYDRVVALKDAKDRKEKLDALNQQGEDAVAAAMGNLLACIHGHPPDELGFRNVRREPLKDRKYVIFSDHHLTFRGHRTNFFSEGGNLRVYASALKKYRDAGYTLVENGDVEDLVIFDPEWTPGEVELRAKMTLKELEARRLVTRKAQLEKILRDPDNKPLIRNARAFTEAGAHIRVAGNHDYDLQRPDFLEVLRSAYPGIDAPADILLLDDEEGNAQFVIAHGHQWDPATCPVMAPRFGETISEVLGLYYQGPDRTWLWGPDKVEDWATGKTAFRNILSPHDVTLKSAVIEELEDLATADADKALTDLGEEIFEALFKHDIAWDYFLHTDPVTAILDEVLTGDRMFKFRILDEERVMNQHRKTFKKEKVKPTLIFGHSHEMRLNAWSETHKAPFEHYLNTASAGRFENMMWAVEIEEGSARLVSWSRKNPPYGLVQRRLWTADGKTAKAAAEPTPL